MSRFAPPPLQKERFQTVGVSELNTLGNPIRTYVFMLDDNTTVEITSPDPGRAHITGRLDDFDPVFGPAFNSVNGGVRPVLSRIR